MGEGGEETEGKASPCKPKAEAPPPGSLPGKPKPDLAARPLSGHSTPHSIPASLWAKHTLFQDPIMVFTNN